MVEIKNVIAQHQPQILGISEANLLDVHDPCLAAIQDYNLHVCPTISNPTLRTSRVVVYTHKNIIPKLRPDLMSDKYAPSGWKWDYLITKDSLSVSPTENGSIQIRVETKHLAQFLSSYQDG